MIKISIQKEMFDVAQEQQILLSQSSDAGALVLFQGMVREFDQHTSLIKLELEHFPNLTEKEIDRIVKSAKSRWNIAGCTVIHRVGELFPEEPIVVVMVTSRHRKEAFAAAEFIMDFLKTEAPFWKKEYFDDGLTQWVEPKHSDKKRKERWYEK